MLSCQLVALLLHKLELDCLFSITTIVNEVQNERLDELASILVNLASVFASFYDAVDLLLLDIQTIFLNGLSEDVLRQIQAYTATIIRSTASHNSNFAKLCLQSVTKLTLKSLFLLFGI